MENLLNQEQIAFLDILFFMLGALVVVGAGMGIGTWLRPYRPHIEKLTSYESGEEPTHTAWAPFNARFYGIGLLFVLFEVETILLFPWALVFTDPELHQATNKGWAYYSSYVGTSFIVVLAVGLLYAYKQKPFEWVQRTPTTPLAPPTSGRQAHYDYINRRYTNRSNMNKTN
jgi:NADH-quinone oxidoreductase subunit A